MRKVLVKGTGITAFGELWDMSLRDLALNASLDAIKDANLSPADIDAVFVANMLASSVAGQSHLGSMVTTQLGINVDATRIEAACASGGLAVLRARESILSGRYKNVLVLGVEKMNDLQSADISTALMEAADEEWETSVGATFPGLYALMAKAYMEKYKATRKDLALVVIKNHKNALMNPIAHLKNQISVEDVLNAPPVATPLGLMDCSPVSDGAAAIVLSEALAKKSDDVFIIGSGVATDTLSLAQRKDYTSLASAVKASQIAYKEANVLSSDMDLAEVHDCFSIAELMAMEDLGFYSKGKSFLAVRKGETDIGSKLPINTSGGLKACGHPVGATGVKQIVEITNQLKEKVGSRQVKNARIGLTHNVGGSGATCVVHILKRE